MLFELPKELTDLVDSLNDEQKDWFLAGLAIKTATDRLFKTSAQFFTEQVLTGKLHPIQFKNCMEGTDRIRNIIAGLTSMVFEEAGVGSEFNLDNYRDNLN